MVTKNEWHEGLCACVFFGQINDLAMVKDDFNLILPFPLINQAYPNIFLVVGMHARGEIKG